MLSKNHDNSSHVPTAIPCIIHFLHGWLWGEERRGIKSIYQDWQIITQTCELVRFLSVLFVIHFRISCRIQLTSLWMWWCPRIPCIQWLWQFWGVMWHVYGRVSFSWDFLRTLLLLWIGKEAAKCHLHHSYLCRLISVDSEFGHLAKVGFHFIILHTGFCVRITNAAYPWVGNCVLTSRRWSIYRNCLAIFCIEIDSNFPCVYLFADIYCLSIDNLYVWHNLMFLLFYLLLQFSQTLSTLCSFMWALPVILSSSWLIFI